ncbi:hypothetical protein BCR44DRAFT_44606 [Catenaria anguillulae PL171]|uniref:Uncharacterized protein n=1 Tax=Catenaria anguillulae PL171 TaxID=765915 RepID=A0A1Y2HAA7_9FUNG|nr:hypothetical protein BCR44DRAFT_44606 [Catenaria anguillulae PL171]
MTDGSNTTSTADRDLAARFHHLEGHLARRLQSPVPPYERTPETLAQLTAAVQDDLTLLGCIDARAQALDGLVTLLANSIRFTHAHLSALGLADTSRLSPSAQSHLDLLAELALRLNLADVSTISMQSAITQRHLDAATQLKAQLEHAKHAAQCEQLAAYFDKEAAQLKHQVDALAPTLANRLEDQQAFAERMPVLEAKLAEYVERLKEIPEHLREPKAEEVTQLAAEVSELEARVREEKEQLKVLREVPPDQLLVRLKLEDARHELEQLKRERETLLVDLARSLAPT